VMYQTPKLISAFFHNLSLAIHIHLITCSNFQIQLHCYCSVAMQQSSHICLKFKCKLITFSLLSIWRVLSALNNLLFIKAILFSMQN